MLLDKNIFATSISKTYLWTPTMCNFFKDILQLAEEATRRCSVKKVFLKHEIHWKTLVLESLYFWRLYWKVTPAPACSRELYKFFKDIYLAEHLRTTAFECAFFFLEVSRIFQKIFKNSNEQILLIYIIHEQKFLIMYIVHTEILKRSSQKWFN